VQSVALRILVEREREIEAFKSQGYWTIKADLPVRRGNGVPGRFGRGQRPENRASPRRWKLFADDYRITTTTLTEAEQVEKTRGPLKKAPYKVSKSRAKKPGAPRTSLYDGHTSGRTLPIVWDSPPLKTMVVAQQLYEGSSWGLKAPSV